MWSREDFSDGERTVKAHFLIEGEEWDRLEYNINTSKSQFLRDSIRRINAAETDLDKLYKRLVLKRNDLRLLELEIEDLKNRIDELERASVKRNVD
ncbi:MAG: hypothetical protein IJF83_07600 [Methanobrevibacter sp.]|nr:hypothetical protein [Methanobrevibacter sp.]